MFYNQVVETWMNVLKEGTNVERTQIASTLMAAITVSAKLDLKETHVRFFDLILPIVPPIFSGSFLLPQTVNVPISTSVNTSMVLLGVQTLLTGTPHSGTFLEMYGP